MNRKIIGQENFGKARITNDGEFARINFTTLDEKARDEFVALFPKSFKMRAQGISTSYADFIPGEPYSVDAHGAKLTVNLQANGVTGDVNEAGVKRFEKAQAIIAAAGIEVA